MQKIPRLIVLVGETASGKSALAMDIARRFDGELICADSWTVYRGFNIGTAKPSATELAEVPHHLLDVADPAVGFSAVEFQGLAKRAIDGIAQRGKLPILVGGTGLYIDAVLYDYQFLPKPDPDQRKELNIKSLLELQQIVKRSELNTEGIDMRNKRRVIRLIENQGLRPTKSDLRPNTLLMGTAVGREHLRERITARTEMMLAAGLESEVRRLAAEYGWDAEPMKGIGYREWRPYFEPRSGISQNLEQTKQRIISATMGLAKRQRTWFKRYDCIHWLTGPDKNTESVGLVTTFLRD